MRNGVFFVLAALVAIATFAVARLVDNAYGFFAGYVVLQYIVLATAWNILGGYTGYVNFGSAAFFAVGVYTTVVIHKTLGLPVPLIMPLGGFLAGILGLGMGYLTLRLRGVFFSIATLALAIVLNSLIVNWSFVGGGRGAYIIRPREIAFFTSYVQYLFVLMLILAALSLWVARMVERSRLGRGLAAIRDDELAAEAAGVPTLKLKLIATTLSGFMMGVAGVPFPYFVTYVEPNGTFSLAYAVNAMAMPLIGGTTSWAGPLIGALLLGTLQQVATVTLSATVNLFIVGILLVLFVTLAPDGILCLGRALLRRLRGRHG
jgi:branched-chain amino acid transport system permease protein